MINAVIYGGVSGLALLFGAWSGIFFKFKQKTTAKFMAFGAGVLICALTFGLMEKSFNHGGFDATIIGFILGGSIFIAGDYLIHVAGGRNHKPQQMIDARAETNGKAITLGALLDGIPESLALGIALFGGGNIGLLMLVAIALSNFPEGISSVTGLKKEGFTEKQIYLTWSIVAVLVTAITVVSYLFLHNINTNAIGTIEAFAAGAILAMLADSMMPEAFDEGGFSIGILTVTGFLLAFILAKL